MTGIRVDKVKKSQTENKEGAPSILTLQFKLHHFNFHFRACLGSSLCNQLQLNLYFLILIEICPPPLLSALNVITESVGHF